ncbi:radical SAM protein [Raoultibacter phocaeensis]|uniref:radical SAM protein n=1 Tax=Raoultibacter phocaeensis TaxID=2479841 RepID=UPI0015D5B00E|nr:radical SAM protein [Raoultibacter phocaeensis]
MLYKTGVEYGDYTMNHVQGCSHGCRYPCYAFLMAKRFGKAKTYEQWCEPKLVSNTLELLDSEIPRYKEKINTVQLCFTTDPFMYGYDEICSMSLASIAKLNENAIPVVALTKGILPRELSGYSAENVYGITLVSLSEEYRVEAEPGASPYLERIAALKALHDAGCKTWVSIEPYPTPNIIKQELDTLLNAVSFADRIIFGRTNYNKTVSSFPEAKRWYTDRAYEVITFCKTHGIDYHIKNGTMLDCARPTETESNKRVLSHR